MSNALGRCFHSRRWMEKRKLWSWINGGKQSLNENFIELLKYLLMKELSCREASLMRLKRVMHTLAKKPCTWLRNDSQSWLISISNPLASSIKHWHVLHRDLSKSTRLSWPAPFTTHDLHQHGEQLQPAATTASHVDTLSSPESAWHPLANTRCHSTAAWRRGSTCDVIRWSGFNERNKQRAWSELVEIMWCWMEIKRIKYWYCHLKTVQQYGAELKKHRSVGTCVCMTVMCLFFRQLIDKHSTTCSNPLGVMHFLRLPLKKNETSSKQWLMETQNNVRWRLVRNGEWWSMTRNNPAVTNNKHH